MFMFNRNYIAFLFIGIADICGSFLVCEIYFQSFVTVFCPINRTVYSPCCVYRASRACKNLSVRVQCYCTPQRAITGYCTLWRAFTSFNALVSGLRGRGTVL